nr:hypothetical protein [Tanacetum cinerariifolium]
MDQPLPRVTQVSISGTSSTEQPHLKDKSIWPDQEKKIQKIDCLARSLLIQGLSIDIYSLSDSNKTAKDLWDALTRHMLGYEYGEQDRKAAILYVYETFKATEGKLLLDTYVQYLHMINDLKKCDLIAEKTEQSKRKEKVVVSSDSEGSDADDFSELKKITAFDSDQEINENMVFMAQIKKVLSDSETSSSSADDNIFEVSYYLSGSESESEYETSEYYDNTTTYGLFVNDNDDQ